MSLSDNCRVVTGKQQRRETNGDDHMNLLSKWFGNARSRSKVRHSAPPGFEQLEGRQLLSASPLSILNGLREVNLRNLAVADYRRDRALTRADTIGLFKEVAADGKVTQKELGDLNTVVGNGANLGMSESVRNLAGKTIGKDPANKLYQEKPLCPSGQLTAGNTGRELTELVDKWFLGMDHPELVEGQSASWKKASGALFGSGGPSYKDVVQGDIGDCYYLATLGEIAARDARAIRGMFSDNGDGTYTVRFYDQLANGTQAPEYVTVDRFLPVQHGSFLYADATNVVWVALAEKAYAELATSGWSRPGMTHGYNSLDQGGSGADPMQQILGEKTHGYDLTAATGTRLLPDVRAGMLVTIGSKATQPKSSAVVDNHEYYVTGYDARTATFTVVNPWGWNNPGQFAGTLHLTLAEIERYFDAFETAAV
jgi:hypothetical protein